MKELSLYVLDLVQNSITAGAKNIKIAVTELCAQDRMTISIEDDGCGMDPEFLKSAVEPFTTTRTTRKVGMGLPFIKMAAEMAGGDFHIESEKGKGTRLRATFMLSHIDRPPIGDMAGTLSVLIQGAPDREFTYIRETDGIRFEFSTTEVKKVLKGVSLAQPEVLEWIRGFVEEGEPKSV